MNVGLASHKTKMNVPNNNINTNLKMPAQYLKTQQYVDEIANWTEIK